MSKHAPAERSSTVLGYLKATTVPELLSKLESDGSLECSSSELMSKLLQHGYEIDELPQLFEHFNRLGFNVDHMESKQNQMEVIKDGLNFGHRRVPRRRQRRKAIRMPHQECLARCPALQLDKEQDWGLQWLVVVDENTRQPNVVAAVQICNHVCTPQRTNLDQTEISL